MGESYSSMKRMFNRITKWLFAISIGSGIAVAATNAVDASLGIIGKDDWLFYKYEVLNPFEETATNTSIDLISRLNKVLFDSGVNLVVVIVPIKMRIYAEHLPEDFKVSPYMYEHYGHVLKTLRADHVDVPDLNGAFLGEARRNMEDPIFFLRDTHWNPTGALLAAEVVKNEIKNSPRLTAAVDATLGVDYKIAIGNLRRPFKGGDLIGQVSRKQVPFIPEQVKPVSVLRFEPEKDRSASMRSSAGIALVGSTYSYEWTGFLDALRYTLQRDIFGAPYGPGEGPWAGLESYLRSPHFQSNRAKLLIWEIPERELRGPPNYRFRDSRFNVDNEEWLLRVSAWAQRTCQLADTSAKIERAGLATKTANFDGANILVGQTKDNEFVQITFNKPLKESDYISARYTTSGTKLITIEGSGAGVGTTRTTLNLVGNDSDQNLKIPITPSAKGVTQIRILPGNSSGFKLGAVQVCRQPPDLLQ